MPRFKKGHKRGGRPRRILSEILGKYGEVTNVRDVQLGKMPINVQEDVADKLWRLATEGYVELNGKILKIKSVLEWLAVVKFIYSQVDGKPHQEPCEDELEIRITRGD